MPEYLDSAFLSDLRKLIDQYKNLKLILGDLAQFRLVLDASFAIKDIARKITDPAVKLTALEETIQAGVVVVHAPIWLDREMTDSTIPQFAERRKVNKELLLIEWEAYKSKLQWCEDYPEPIPVNDPEFDPKDMPYILTERYLAADGILSDDPHISNMGGNRLSLDFVLTVRTYARSEVVVTSVCVSGVFLGTITVKLFSGLVSYIREIFSKLPGSLKVILLIGGVALVVHPKSREWLVDQFMEFGMSASKYWPEVTKFIQFCKEEQQKSQEARSSAEADTRRKLCGAGLGTTEP